MITLITPTRSRPVSFSLAEKWMARQTFQDFRWIVVNDSPEEDQDRYAYTLGQKVVRRKHEEAPPFANVMIQQEGDQFPKPLLRHNHSLCENVLAGLKAAGRADRFAIIEDDDWYGPTYLENLNRLLDSADLAGFNQACYYNLRFRRWKYLRNESHCSLASTGFRRSVVPLVRTIAERGDPFIDLQLWNEWDGSKALENTKQPRPLMVGLKGNSEHAGVSIPNHEQPVGTEDLGGKVFREWLGLDANEYEEAVCPIM